MPVTCSWSSTASPARYRHGVGRGILVPGVVLHVAFSFSVLTVSLANQVSGVARAPRFRWYLVTPRMLELEFVPSGNSTIVQLLGKVVFEKLNKGIRSYRRPDDDPFGPFPHRIEQLEEVVGDILDDHAKAFARTTYQTSPHHCLRI